MGNVSIIRVPLAKNMFQAHGAAVEGLDGLELDVE